MAQLGSRCGMRSAACYVGLSACGLCSQRTHPPALSPSVETVSIDSRLVSAVNASVRLCQSSGDCMATAPAVCVSGPEAAACPADRPLYLSWSGALPFSPVSITAKVVLLGSYQGDGQYGTVLWSGTVSNATSVFQMPVCINRSRVALGSRVQPLLRVVSPSGEVIDFPPPDQPGLGSLVDLTPPVPATDAAVSNGAVLGSHMPWQATDVPQVAVPGFADPDTNVSRVVVSLLKNNSNNWLPVPSAKVESLYNSPNVSASVVVWPPAIRLGSCVKYKWRVEVASGAGCALVQESPVFAYDLEPPYKLNITELRIVQVRPERCGFWLAQVSTRATCVRPRPLLCPLHMCRTTQVSHQ